MGFLDKAKAAAEQATTRVKDEVDDVQAKRGLGQAYAKLGEATFALLESGEISHPSLVAPADEIRALKERTDAPPAATGESTEPAPPPAMPA